MKKRDAIEIIEIHAMLEAIVARHTAQRATAADLERLRAPDREGTFNAD